MKYNDSLIIVASSYTNTQTLGLFVYFILIGLESAGIGRSPLCQKSINRPTVYL